MGLARISEIVEKCEQIKDELKTEVFGQDKAVEDVMDSIANSILYEDEDSTRPKGIFLFAGTPGVGKTYLATKCAEHLGYDSITLNMSSFSGRDEGKLSLFGSDGSYKNSKDGMLLEFVEKQNGEPCMNLKKHIQRLYCNSFRFYRMVKLKIFI